MLDHPNIAEIRLYFKHLLIMGLELRKIDFVRYYFEVQYRRLFL